MATHNNQKMHVLKRDGAGSGSGQAGNIPKSPLTSNPLASRHEYSVSRIINMDKCLVEDAANNCNAPNAVLCELCSQITGVLGKNVDKGDTFGRPTPTDVYVYPVKGMSLAIRICTCPCGEGIPYCTISLHGIHGDNNEKLLEELGRGSQHGTNPRESGTGMLIGIRHPGSNAGENINVPLISMCILKMFQDAEFAQKFADARLS